MTSRSLSADGSALLCDGLRPRGAAELDPPALARHARELEDQVEARLRRHPESRQILDDRRANEKLRAWMVRRMGRAVAAIPSRTERERLEDMVRAASQYRWALALTADEHVHQEARRLAACGHDYDDIRQLGRIGLYAAALRFDPDRGTSFRVYARHWVWQTLNRYTLSTTTPLGMPPRAAQERLRIKRISDRYDGHRSTAQLAREAGVTEDRVIDLLYVDDVSERIGGDTPPDRRPVEEVLSDDDALTGEQLLIRRAGIDAIRQRLAPAIGALSTRQQHVIVAHYGLDASAQSLREIADELGLTRRRVLRIRREALRAIRQHLAAGGA